MANECEYFRWNEIVFLFLLYTHGRMCHSLQVKISDIFQAKRRRKEPHPYQQDNAFITNWIRNSHWKFIIGYRVIRMFGSCRLKTTTMHVWILQYTKSIHQCGMFWRAYYVAHLELSCVVAFFFYFLCHAMHRHAVCTTIMAYIKTIQNTY